MFQHNFYSVSELLILWTVLSVFLSITCVISGNLCRFGYPFIISLVTGKSKYEINTLMKKVSCSFITVVSSYYHVFPSHCRIVRIWFYLETSSPAQFSLFYDLITSFYTKGKCQWQYFVLNHIVLIINYFFTSPISLHLIWRVYWIRSCLV